MSSPSPPEGPTGPPPADGVPPESWPPSGYKYQWEPTPRPRRPWHARHRFLIYVGVVVGCGLLGAAIVNAAPDRDKPKPTAQPKPTPTTAESTLEQETDPDATITMDATCKYILDFENGHEFVASAFLHNPGNLQAKARVKATWRQAGGKAVTQVKTVTVPAGAKDYEVTFKKKATDAQINKIQALDTERQCTVTGGAAP